MKNKQNSLSFLPSHERDWNAVSPFVEMGAYEAMWAECKSVSFKTLAARFAAHPGSVPSDFVKGEKCNEYSRFVQDRFAEVGLESFGVQLNGMMEYPLTLRDAAHPVELFYYSGAWGLSWSPSVAVVGTRNPSGDGLKRARRLVKALVKDDFTVVSGLAAGIDTIAHRTAMEEGGCTIAVIGTPLSETYPRQNDQLQQEIIKRFLVISQVPVKRYSMQDYRSNRLFFLERNVTMSALTRATVIVEAGKTSGTFIQARAALKQGRSLFIMNSCFDRGLQWPERLEAEGAIRVRDYDDIAKQIPKTFDKG